MGRNDNRSAAENAQNGETALPVANLMADSESGTPISYSRLIVATALTHLVSEVFTYDTQTDGHHVLLL